MSDRWIHELCGLLILFACLPVVARAGDDRPDPCAKMTADSSPRPMRPVPQPAAGESYVDPSFGARVVRITDVQNQFGSLIAKPVYSTIPAWNADESLFILYVTEGRTKGHALFDGRTYRFIRMLEIGPVDIEHVYWSATEPNILYYPHASELSGKQLRYLLKYDVVTKQHTPLREFSARYWAVDFGGDPMRGAWNSNLFGMRARSRVDAGLLVSVDPPRETEPRPGPGFQVSPSGRYYVQGDSLFDARTQAFVRRMNVVTHEHADMGMTAAGRDFWAAVQFDGRYQGSLVVEWLDTGEVKTLIGAKTGYPYPPSGTHLSAVAFRNPGWVAISIVGNSRGATLLNQEILMANVETGRMCRVAHHRSAVNDKYWAEPHATVSPSGTRIMFASDWGGTRPVDTYVVELPAYKAGAPMAAPR